jgi:hypothetical protein
MIKIGSKVKVVKGKCNLVIGQILQSNNHIQLWDYVPFVKAMCKLSDKRQYQVVGYKPDTGELKILVGRHLVWVKPHYFELVALA